MENTVSFKVSGSELSNFIDEIQKKQDKLSDTAVSDAMKQVKNGKEAIKIIEEEMRAIEKRNKAVASAVVQEIENKKKEELRKIEEKRKKDSDFLESKKGKEDYPDEWIDSRKRRVEGTAERANEKVENKYKEQLTSSKELERQAKLQTSLDREHIETLKQTAKENIKAISNGDLKLSDVIKDAQSDDEKLVARLTEEGIRSEKKLVDKEGTASSMGAGKSVFGSLLALDVLNKAINSVGQLASSQNGFDMIKPTSSLVGQIAGGVIGGVAGFFLGGGVGVVGGASGGAAIGGAVGSTTGELFQRSAIAKQEFQRNKGHYNAVTGSDELPTSTNTENYGVGVTDYLKMQTDFAIKRGDSKNANKTATDALTADKVLGVDQGTSGALVELQRSAKESNRDLAGLISGVLEKGNGNIFKNGDHSYLNEFLGKFIGLQKELLKNQSTVASGTTMDILSQFNKLGGEFDSRDSRSQGNINAVQNGLVNPETDNVKALTFGMLRQQMPNASPWEIDSERSKGLGSDVYKNAVFKFLKEQGGDESSKKFNIKGFFKGLSNSGVDRIYDNLDELSTHKTSMDDLEKKYGSDFSGKAANNTAPIDKGKASVDNGLLQDKFATIEALADAFKTAIESSMSGAVIEINGGKISFPSKGAIIKSNEANKAWQSKADDYNWNRIAQTLH